ncbi:hypothetical protein Tco_1453844, partial [Tanacetum coccineum]
SEPTNLDADEAIHKESGDSVERAATTAATLDAEQDSGNINRTQSTAIPNVPFPQGIGSGGSPRCQEAIGDTIAQTRSERVSTPSYDSPLLEVNTPGNDEERIKLKELMDMCTKLSDMVLDLDNVKDAQALEIKKLKKRVKELERRNKSRTPQPKRRVYKPRVKSFEESLEVIIDKKEPTELVEDKGSDEKVVGAAKDKDSTVDPVTTASETVTTAVDVSVGSPTRLVDDSTTDDVTLAETLMAIRRSASRPQKLKGVRVVFKELNEETRLEREREEEASNAALIEEWDSIEARIYADAQLAERLQEEEREHMSVEEQARLLMELIATRKKLFTAKRAEEQRNKPPTKGKSFDAIKKMFDKAYKHVNDFVPMDTKSSGKKVDNSRKKAESSKKRTRAVLGEESVKRQNVEDDAEKAELKACLEIVPSDDSAVNIKSLATKYPIVDWKTHILAEDIIYYQIIRADGSTKNYKIFSAMLDDFDRQDVLDLYRLVKGRFETTSPEGYDRLLWGDLITLFKPRRKMKYGKLNRTTH